MTSSIFSPSEIVEAGVRTSFRSSSFPLDLPASDPGREISFLKRVDYGSSPLLSSEALWLVSLSDAGGFILVPMPDFTQLLHAIDAGDPKAAEELLPLVYGELRRLASAKMARESAGHTLQPTALVHEAWLRLGGSEAPSFQDRAHFFGAAAEAMRRILIERARRRIAAKRGGGAAPAVLDEIDIPSPVADDDQLLAVNEALGKFAVLDPRKAELVKLRYFVGMSFDEAATALGIAVPTAKQWWAYARAWLTVELRRR